MAHPADVARGRNIVARWCTLAEQRLEYLTDLFETGRWRRFHTEREFLENIQEAKAAVITWRDLLGREASLDNTEVDLAWLGRRRTAPLPLTPLPRDEGFRRPIVQLAPQPAPVAARPQEDDILLGLESRIAVAKEKSPTPDVLVLDEISLPALDLDAIREKYPLLRNTL
jgi:uncharacterized repeat protein (TIGR03809 family)